MLKNGKTTLLAVAGALALMASAPAIAQDAATAPAAAQAPGANAAAAGGTAPGAAGAPAATPTAGVTDAAGASTTGAATPSDNDGDGTTAEGESEGEGGGHGRITPVGMFMDAGLVVKAVMIGLILASIFSWTLLIIKMIEFMSLNKSTDRFLEAFRGARSIQDMGRIATSEEFQGNPLAGGRWGGARQAGLNVTGEHRESTIARAQSAVAAVQAGLAKRLSNGMQFLASVGSSGPFIGLFGTVWGIMTSFIGIAESNTTNLAVVAPGIAEALLATGIGLFAAIPSVIFYNYFQTRIAAFGTRSEAFVAELMNAMSRQLDKGA
jgi:biopolymer transport protein ExbB